jgi:hypothetical protein
VTTSRDVRPGFHGKAVASGGSFDMAGGYLAGQYGWGRNTFSLSGNSARTDRYLDPPAEQNYSNRGTTGSISGHFERDLSDKDRLGLIWRREQARFLVPNEVVQEQVGQRQDRESYETVGQLSYQHVFSASVIGDFRGMVRDLSAGLWSNALATPIIAMQDRGFREGYFKTAVSGHQGRHEWKAGVEADFGSLREGFSYRITNRAVFDPDTPRRFSFADRAQDREQAAFVQDLIRLGNWTVSAGLRWDHYRLRVDENAVSPRLGVAWYWRGADLILRGSYDRAFQTPAFENLLLASSLAVTSLNDNAVRLPVRPSRANYYEAGFTKGLWRKLRLDANWFRRDIRDFADDDVLLNTGVSFPISFQRASIQGIEAKLEVPRWGPFSGWLSYSNSRGTGYLPVTGGLFLGDAAAGALQASGGFPITQDQRNTARARVRYQVAPRLWTAFGAGYGSGLPVEFEGTPEDAMAQYGDRIASRVNFDRGRLHPMFTVDASAGLDLWKTEHRAARLQADFQNLTNRLNVINFAGLFSGTAIGSPRAYSVKMSFEF